MKRLRDEVARELGRMSGAAGAAGTLPRILEEWPAAVGSTIARNAWPARTGRDGTLHVATSSSAWAFELAQLEADVLGRLRAALGAEAPPRLRFAVGKLPEPGREEAEGDAPRRAAPRPVELAEGARVAAAIDDEELRLLVAKAAAHSLAAGGSNRRF